MSMSEGFHEKKGSDASFVHVEHPNDSCPSFFEYEVLDYDDAPEEKEMLPLAVEQTAPLALAEAREVDAEEVGALSLPSTSWSETEYQQVQEAKVAKDIEDIQQAAYDYTMKLTAGLKSAIGGFGKADSQGLSQLGGSFANWWAPSEPRNQPQQVEAQRLLQSKGQDGELHELLGLLPEERLVESFKCKLVQTYGCSHNCFTPDIQMAFQGTLYITDQHCCFLVEERNSRLPFKVLHRDIVKAVRQRQQRKGDLSDILHLSQDACGQQYLAFKDFGSSGALDSALALVQHLMEA